MPWNHDITKEPYDGLFLSNGPGDPKMANETMEFVRKIVVDEVGVNPMNPIFGICMGNQLLGTAAGAETYKMPFGNRGQNVPVLNLLTGECTITPQNHGYALDVDKLPRRLGPAVRESQRWHKRRNIPLRETFLFCSVPSRI